VVGNPSAVPGTVPAQPGDTLVLWGTGFGATVPPMPAGMVVSSAAEVAAPLTVSVGGATVPVISAVLTPGFAGLYQVTVQLPAILPSGALLVEVSVAGVVSPMGASIFVAQ